MPDKKPIEVWREKLAALQVAEATAECREWAVARRTTTVLEWNIFF